MKVRAKHFNVCFGNHTWKIFFTRFFIYYDYKNIEKDYIYIRNK